MTTVQPPVTVTPGELATKSRGRKPIANPWLDYVASLPLDNAGKSPTLSFQSEAPKKDVRHLKNAATVRNVAVTVQVDGGTVTFQLRPKRVYNV